MTKHTPKNIVGPKTRGILLKDEGKHIWAEERILDTKILMI